MRKHGQTCTIDRITLDNALPRIFHGRDMTDSEVWRKPLTLERGGVYLIEAASGTGKTSHMFQELRLFPELTALENVEIKNSLTHWRGARQVDEWFDAFGIADKRDEPVGRMSFGQQQRVAMIRALVQPFSFLLADEPISHLDDTNSRAMAEVMLAEARAQGAGLVVTSVGKHMDFPYSQTFRL